MAEIAGVELSSGVILGEIKNSVGVIRNKGAGRVVFELNNLLR